MLNLTEYWQGVRAEQAKIADEWPILMSLGNSLRGRVGGATVEVSRENAARFIFDGSHRLATPEEILKHRAAEERRAAVANDAAMKKAGFGVFILPHAKKENSGRK